MEKCNHRELAAQLWITARKEYHKGYNVDTIPAFSIYLPTIYSGVGGNFYEI